jgi:hypothetical protein
MGMVEPGIPYLAVQDRDPVFVDSPSDVTTSAFRPKSIPTSRSQEGSGTVSRSTTNEA